ncbi:MAG: serine/threonine-protein kinase [Cyanobacteria bacterium J06554_6]
MSSKSSPTHPATDVGKAATTVTLPRHPWGSQYWQKFRPKTWRQLLKWTCFSSAMLATALNPVPVQSIERQVQTFFWELRGPVSPPVDVVILAIDDESLSQGQHYLDEPERYPELGGISAWPWQRQVYAQVIQKLIKSGARAVAIDLVFSTPSAYGPGDDRALAAALQQYGDQVVLAAKLGDLDLRQGVLLQPTLPVSDLQDTAAHIGMINFIVEPNGQIHRLSDEFLKIVEQAEQELTGLPAFEEERLPSFAEATLQAANLELPRHPGDHIFFYGPTGTFEQIPFWYALDDDSWSSQLDSGAFFKGKIVLIGSTAILHRDFHSTPFSQTQRYPAALSGVEILANTVATLRSQQSVRQLPVWIGLGLVALGLIAASRVRAQASSKQMLQQGLWILSSAVFWGALSYALFIGGRWLMPTAVPILGIVGAGTIDLGATVVSERLKKKNLRQTLARYVTSPIVQEIISQQDDMQDLLVVQPDAMAGKILSDRYRIVEVLGAGGFGETYLAEDTQRPGNPICVVKQLKIVSDNPGAHRLAQRLFAAEAATLEKLGEHDQIPRLLAYFEDNYAFYLVQEMIEGKLLRDRLSNYQPMSQRAVVRLMLDLLPVIQSVHEYGVIHRDIKPSNIIQRASDRRYVLIDFGAVKQISNQLTDTNARVTATVGIGTHGYMPSEQSAGLPNFSSDLYALGITCIEALTGLPPHALERSDTGEILWKHKIPLLQPDLATIIGRLVRYDFNQRYPQARIAYQALSQISLDALPSEPPVRAPVRPTSDEPGVVNVDPSLDQTVLLPKGWGADYQPTYSISQGDTEADVEGA